MKRKDMRTYKNRIADRLLKRRLAGVGAVLIEGPKWCGKTTTAVQHAASTLYLDDPKSLAQNLQMAEINPAALLSGPAPPFRQKPIKSITPGQGALPG